MYIYIHINILTCIHIYIYMYTYIYIYAHTHIHIQILTHICTLVQLFFNISCHTHKRIVSNINNSHYICISLGTYSCAYSSMSPRFIQKCRKKCSFFSAQKKMLGTKERRINRVFFNICVSAHQCTCMRKTCVYQYTYV